MNITVNKNTIRYLYSDKTFTREIERFLNSVIDEEIEKEDNMDTELIDECIEILSRLDEEDDNAIIIPFISSEKIISLCQKKKFKMFSRGVRAVLIACIILFSLFTANTVIAKVFDYDILQETMNTISDKLQDIGIISSENDKAITIASIPMHPDSSTDDDKKSEEQATQSTPKASKPIVNAKSSLSTRTENSQSENSSQVADSSVKETSSVKPPVLIDPIESPIEYKKNKTYTLYLDANGGVCSVKRVEVEYGKKIPELPNPEPRDGYAFLGWYSLELLKLNSTTTVWIKPDWIYKNEGDLTAVASWDKLYTLHLDPNGGKCDTKPLTVGYNNQKNKLPVPVREGYKFDGWYYGENRVGNYGYHSSYKESDEDNINLVAHWSEIINYTLFFDINGGTCAVDSKIVRAGEPYGELPVPTRDGYTFLGWYEDKEYQFDEITAEDLFGSKKNKTVYAIWGDNKRRVKVRFDPVDGECDTEYKYAYYDRMYGDLPVPTKYGYTFSGWTNEKGDTVSSKTYMLYSSGEVTLYANYKICNISLLFDSNYSGGRYYRKSVEYMSKIGELPHLNVTRIGYSFDGWYTEREGGRKVEPTDIVDFAEYTIYYAHWIKLEDCKITIHKNDGSGKIYTGTIANGDTFDISEVEIPENDKVFIGWYDKEKGGEKIQGKLKITQDIDIYAHWKTDGYCVITAHIGDKARRVEVSEVKYGEPLGDLYYNVNGATFLGWYTEEYYGERLDENTIITQDIDIYAHWSKYYGSVIVKELYKSSYHLNEKVSPYDFKLQYKIGSSYDIDEEGMTRVRCTADTSDYGTRTVYFTFIHDYEEGVFTYTGEGTIFVDGCPHDSTTHIEDACVPSCKTPTGYTGDTICDRCGVIIDKGESIESLIHTENYHSKLINAVDPTCVEEGYSGDLVCTDCNQTIRKGEVISALGHNENTKTITYDVEPGCSFYGYKGRVECAECSEILDWGEEIEPIGHDENTPVKIIKKVDATCTNDGYTGDALCLECGHTIKRGEVIPAMGHNYTRYTEKAKFDSTGLIKDVCNRCHHLVVVEEIPSARLKISTRQLSYNAMVQAPEISVTNVPEDCYTLETEKGSEIGYYKVTAALSGDYYEGTKTDYYRILPPNTDIEMLTARSKGIVVKPSNICDAVDGYQIEYRVNQVMPVVTTVNFANNGRTEFVKTGLESKTSYMVRIRAYKNVVEDSKNARYYSDWSNYKYITTLK